MNTAIEALKMKREKRKSQDMDYNAMYFSSYWNMGFEVQWNDYAKLNITVLMERI
jgi:hypothetical protein